MSRLNPSQQRHLAITYEIISCCLAFCALILAIMHFMGVGTGLSYLASSLIYFFFLFDYVVALFRCPTWQARKKYIHQHLWEFVALMPINLLLSDQSLRHLFQLLRSIAYLMRFMNRARNFFDTCGFKYALALFFMLIAVAAWGFHYFENRSLFESGWWAVTTVTTVGYGDVVPVTAAGKLIAIGLMGIGVIFIGLIASTITTFITKNKTKEHTPANSRQAIIEQVKQEIDRLDSLSDEDIDTLARTLKSVRKPREKQGD